jgi:hypothetical protein
LGQNVTVDVVNLDVSSRHRPPCLGPSGWPGSTPSAALRWPLRGSAPWPPLLHHQVAGQVDCRIATADCRAHAQAGLAATKRVSFSDPLVSSPSSPAPPRDGPGTVFLPGEEVFARPGPAAPSQPPQKRYPSRQRAPPQRLDL